jgi:hypothetical protein
LQSDFARSAVVAAFFVFASHGAIADKTNGVPPVCETCEIRSGTTEDADARAYLVDTAGPGNTMSRQGSLLAIERLHPDFARRIASAIREAREAGLKNAGIFSAYRPPAFGVGGFADKFNSLHAYGLAVDMLGIGKAGSPDAKLWYEIAAKHDVVCPYGHNNRAEWNHCQPTHLRIVRPENPLRATIAADGPVSLEHMFAVGTFVMTEIENAAGSLLDGVQPPIRAAHREHPSGRGGKGVQQSRSFVVAKDQRRSKANQRLGTRKKSAHNSIDPSKLTISIPEVGARSTKGKSAQRWSQNRQ